MKAQHDNKVIALEREKEAVLKTIAEKDEAITTLQHERQDEQFFHNKQIDDMSLAILRLESEKIKLQHEIRSKKNVVRVLVGLLVLTVVLAIYSAV